MAAAQDATPESEESVTSGLQALSISTPATDRGTDEKKPRDNTPHADDRTQSAGAFVLLDRQTTPGLVLKLSRECVGSVLNAEEFNASRLSDKTGAKVTISRDTGDFILKAWGDQEALGQVKDEVKQMEMKSKHLRPAFNRRQSFVEGGHTIVFEGFTSPDDNVKLLRYDGENNPGNDNKTLYSPYLFIDGVLHNTGGNDADFGSFLKTLQRQGECIRDEHDESMHGKLRAIARYGNVYVYNKRHLPPKINVEMFDLDINKGHRPADDLGGVSADSRGSRRRTGRGRDRGRGRGGPGMGRQIDPFMRHSFIPSAATKDVLQKFLDTFHFEELTRKEQYNVTARFEKVTGGDNTIILDKDLNFIEFRPPDVKWMALDLKRRPTSDTYPFGTDIRFKLQSRRILTEDEVEKIEAYKKFFDPDHKVLEQGHSYDLQGLHGEPNLPIHPDYRGTVDFARRKVIRRFRARAADAVQHSRFRKDVEVRLTEVWEYSRPDSSGRFTRVIPGRQEVTVIPPLPDWTRPEEVETSAREYWQFCLELGDTLYP